MPAVRVNARRWAVAVAVATCLAVIGVASPAHAHVGFPSAMGFGDAPNTAGGTGIDGAAPPYVPGTRNTLFLRAQNEQVDPFNGSDDTTVDLKIVVPAGFTAPACGQARQDLKDITTNGTSQPGAVVAGWSCAVETANAHSVIHFWGPQVVAPATKADAAEWYSFLVTVPTPAVDTTYGLDAGTEGFSADQQYASGLVTQWVPPNMSASAPNATATAGLERTVGGPGTGFHAVAPTRILDSRTGTGWSGPLSAGTARELTVTGANSVPAGVDAVVVNVTATDSDANSFLTVYPAGTVPPTASNVNFAANETIPNLVTVKVSADGKVDFATNSGSTDVVADLVGYYDHQATDRFNPLAPTRVLDSRTATGGFNGPVHAGSPKNLLFPTGGVSATATAVVMNVTVTGSDQNSFLTVYPAGPSTPTASNLNFAVGQTIANLVTVPVGSGGAVTFATAAGQVDVIADVVGYYDGTQGNRFHSLAPRRILDSRTTIGGWAGALSAGADQDLQVKGYGGVRTDATSVVANVTVTGGTQNSYLTAYPTGQSLPSASNVNFAVGQTIPNLTAVKLGDFGRVRFDNHLGSAQVIYDVVGYFAPV